ncbi:MAG: hypothetical protein K2K38_01170 [Clostridia bacterium]|nr:hypothetical protein [Clostridia bacterium]
MKKNLLIITIILGTLTIATLLVLGLVDKFCSKPILTVSDWLEASCSILSFIGTTALAIVAVWQTEKANKQNEDLIEQNKELQKINDKQFMIANQENYPMIQVAKTLVEQHDSCLFSPETKNFCRVIQENEIKEVVYSLAYNYQNKQSKILSLFIKLINDSRAKIVSLKIVKVDLIKPICKSYKVNWDIMINNNECEFYIRLNNDTTEDMFDCCLYFEIETNTGVKFYQKISIYARKNINYIMYENILTEKWLDL